MSSEWLVGSRDVNYRLMRPSRFRVRLWALMLMIAVAGLWLGRLTNRAQSQRRAIEAVVRVGGGVAYDYQFVDGDPRKGTLPGGKPWAPRWLRSMIGEEFFREVVLAGFSSKPPDRPTLNRLKDFPRLRSLYITGNPFGDAEMVYLRDLGELRELYLGSTTVSDAGLAHLRSLRRLKDIGLSGTRVSEAGAAELRLSLPDTNLRR